MLVGRVQELAALDAALERREGVVAIVGEPGIGKSRLLAEVAARAPGEALAARASEAEHDLPYAVWNEALGDRRIELSDARLVEAARWPSQATAPPRWPCSPRPSERSTRSARAGCATTRSASCAVSAAASSAARPPGTPARSPRSPNASARSPSSSPAAARTLRSPISSW